MSPRTPVADNRDQCSLLRFLREIRAAGLAVDIGKCLLLLRALEGGFGFDPDRLHGLLRALFASSETERRILDHHYGRFLAGIEEQRAATGTGSHAASVPDAEKLRHQVNALERQIGEAFTLLRPDSPAEAVAESSAVVTRIIQVSPARDEAELLEAGGFAVSPRDYMPLTRRQMRQNWRYLRLPVREGKAVEFDARATFSKISRDGVFLEPVLRPRRVSRCELVLLIDVHGSMSPFHDLGRRLMNTALDGGRFRRVRTFYFHNAPDDWLMTSPGFTDAFSVKRFIDDTPDRPTVLAIVSDAGAARRSRNDARVEQTHRFVKRLSTTRLRFVWLNPVPRGRWGGTSAEMIERFVPMFEINRLGMDRAIAALKRPSGRDARPA